jgi:hypothetical protein
VGSIFLSNPWLNGVILGVFVLGVLTCFWQVAQLVNSAIWIERFATDRPGHEATAPRLLAPLAALLRARGARMQISSSSTRSILDSVATRIEEERDITRYIVNLLIFLGLLGTFYGLATTVPAVVETIRSLEPQEGDAGVDVFGRLMTGLEKQLGGMGTAFSSSLLGLAGSLVVGLLELFAGHGQNRFYRELEEWLSSITRLGFSSGDADAAGGGFDGGTVAAVLDHMVEQMESLQNIFVQSDISRAAIDDKIGTLTEAVSALVAARRHDNDSSDALARIAAGQELIAEGQERLIRVLEDRAEAAPGGAQVDAESRMRLRSIDVQLLRILEEMAAGRQESLAALRGDLATLSKALRQTNRDAAERAATDAGRRRG